MPVSSAKRCTVQPLACRASFKVIDIATFHEVASAVVAFCLPRSHFKSFDLICQPLFSKKFLTRLRSNDAEDRNRAKKVKAGEGCTHRRKSEIRLCLNNKSEGR